MTFVASRGHLNPPAKEVDDREGIVKYNLFIWLYYNLAVYFCLAAKTMKVSDENLIDVAFITS
eukprot:CAMPEP_0173085672 /NCGR_PEP_ID=MMETSP1102-20130122/21952_1 /TAXON_ID=49646 /ORGANISM="Geminigera sp., Strain Caron Lab Isolate" /LENGTH=62 /DNA_ID=CAMNT_0013965377 /DNA_START=119 /DNA_END=307 /DNA_ORIENTATION=+